MIWRVLVLYVLKYLYIRFLFAHWKKFLNLSNIFLNSINNKEMFT